MAKVVRQLGRALWVILPLVALALFFLLPPKAAQGATYTTPWWTNTSPSPEKACDNCGCESPPEIVLPGVSVRTGEVILDIGVASSPGMLGSIDLSLRWRSYQSGATDFGRAIVPSLYTMVKETILIGGNPQGPGGHKADVYLPTGLIVSYTWSGSAYTTSDCCFHGVLSKNGSGHYLLTDLDGSTRLFDGNGLPDVYADSNNNQLDFTFNGSLQWTALTDDRGQTWTVHHDGDGWVDYVDLPSGARWSFGHDGDGNLTTISSPATADQTSGITRTLQYDSYERLTTITDGNGTDEWTYTYVSTSGQVDYATGSTIDFAYTTGRTDVTDPRGNVMRYHYSGNNVTKVEHWIGSASTWATEYRWTGSTLDTIVYPRGNRVDFTRNGMGFVTEKRRKTTDTSSTSSSDIVVGCQKTPSASTG